MQYNGEQSMKKRFYGVASAALVAALAQTGCHPSLDDVARPCGLAGQTCSAGEVCMDGRCVPGAPDMRTPDRGTADGPGADATTLDGAGADGKQVDLVAADAMKPDGPGVDAPKSDGPALDSAVLDNAVLDNAVIKPDAPAPDSTQMSDALAPDTGGPVGTLKLLHGTFSALGPLSPGSGNFKILELDFVSGERLCGTKVCVRGGITP